MSTTKFEVDLIRNTFYQFFNTRVVFICAAGSIVHNRASQTSDLDLMLVLDTYRDEDIELCRHVTALLQKEYYLVGISLQYKDEIPSKSEDVQDGSKGSLALAYINSAYVIAGDNIYKTLFDNLNENEFRRSIIRTLEEYLHRMYALVFNDKTDEVVLRKESLKFLCRAIIDTMLYYFPSDMEEYDKLTNEEVLLAYKNHPKIKRITSKITPNSSPILMVQSLRMIIIQLKKDQKILT